MRAVSFLGPLLAAGVVPRSESALVQAVDMADAAGGGDLIFAPFCPYTLTSAHSSGGAGQAAGLPNITAPVSMTGLGTDIVRAAGAPRFRIFEVDGPSQAPGAAGQLTLSAVTVRGGDADLGVGGGIANLGGAVTLTGSTVRDNRASYGGGIYTDTALTMTAGSVTGNTATVNGGGIYRNAGSATLLAGNVSGNAPNDCAATAPWTAPC